MFLDLTPEQAAFRDEVARFAQEVVAPRAAAIDSSGQFPSDVIRAAGELGLLGVTIPATWGGAGRDYLSYALAIESIGRASATVATSLAVTNSLVAELVEHAGTDAQRDRWLRALTRGDTVGAFALSEAGAGTDAANQQATATPVDGGYRLVGRKVWVANAAAAGVIVVFAATQPGRRGQGVSAFLVAGDAPGIAKTAVDDSLGVRGLGCMDLDLDLTVPSDQLLGGVDEGFGLAMWALQGGRVAIAAQALGIGQAALDEAIAHARTREQFGRPIAQFEAIQWMIADSATELDAARMLMWKAASVKARGEPGAVESSMAKLAASEAAHHAADKAMQVLASAGYRRGSVVERLFRDVRATEIYQGTSEAQRMIIAKHLSR
jgi:alkylation response protein AidB-like acyl-CoA dehydrogenase